MRHRHRFNPKHDPPSRRELEFGIKQRRDLTPENYTPRPYGAPSQAQIWRPETFYAENLQPTSAFTVGGPEIDLIGGNVQPLGQGTSVQHPGRLPMHYRGTVDLFKPIALDGFSMPVKAFPAGTSVVWRLYVGGRTAHGFETRSVFVGGTDQYAGRALAEVKEGQVLRVTAQLVSNAMGITQIGVQLGGVWHPIHAENAQGRAR